MLLLVHVSPLPAKACNEGVDFAGFPDGHTRGQLDPWRELAVLHALPPAAAADAHAGGDVGDYAEQAVLLGLIKFCWHGFSLAVVAVQKPKPDQQPTCAVKQVGDTIKVPSLGDFQGFRVLAV